MTPFIINASFIMKGITINVKFMRNLILQEIIKQNQHWQDLGEKESIAPYKRKLFYKLIDYLKEKQILSIVGLRRTGKTTILKQIIKYLIEEKKINPQNILFISFDEALVTAKLTLNKYLDVFLDQTSDKQLKYIFLDEIQYVDKWQHILKRYYDTRPKIKFIISGSASLFIQKKSSESLAGRIYEFRLPPLDFEEFLEISKQNKELIASYKKFSLTDFDLNKNDFYPKKVELFLTKYGDKLQHLFEQYLLFYQFPETIFKDKEKIYKYLKEAIYKKTIEYDIPRLFDIDKIDELKFVFRFLISETANEIEYSAIAQETGIDINTLKRYISYYHNSLLFDVIYNYSKSIRKSKRLQKKGYIASPNFFSAFHLDFFKLQPISWQYLGRLVETYVYNILKQKFEYISFYKKREKEIDFICHNEILDKSGAKIIEVKYVNNLKREHFSFLKKVALEIFKAKQYYIFSKNQFFVSQEKIVLPCFLLNFK